jgi:hypothetical protein
MTAAAASMTARTAGRLGSWLSVRHSLRTEAATVLALYGLYELARGLLVGAAAQADRHAHRLVALVQRAAHAFPGLTSLLGLANLTLVASAAWRRTRAGPTREDDPDPEPRPDPLPVAPAVGEVSR